MKKIKVSILFINASGGMVHVVIQSASSNYSYDVDGNYNGDHRSLDLKPGFYNIRVHGMTGGSVVIDVTGDLPISIHETKEGPHIYYQETFSVQ